MIVTHDDIQDGYRFIRNFFAKYRYKAQQSDVEDVYQRAVLRSLETGSSPTGTNFYAYLKYSCLKFFRDDLPKSQHDSLEEASDIAMSEKDCNLASIMEDMEKIRPILDDMSPSRREAVLMEYWGMSPKTAAAASDRTLGAVYVGRCCGVNTLRERLTKST
jgi:DNA-directed RNA polymerase specialized sigma24 family protein